MCDIFNQQKPDDTPTSAEAQMCVHGADAGAAEVLRFVALQMRMQHAHSLFERNHLQCN